MNVRMICHMLPWILCLGAVAQESEDGRLPRCKDKIEGKLIVDSSLDSDFFRSREVSRPWWIVEHEDGSIENTFGDKLSHDELAFYEHTAKCISTHQGEHLMSLCDAVMVKGNSVRLGLHGGMPAYASSLSVVIDQDLKFRCAFKATYPRQVGELKWKITKKEFSVLSDQLKAGTRLYGWISVEFDEITEKEGKEIQRTSHKIEGYVKPVIVNFSESRGQSEKGEIEK